MDRCIYIVLMAVALLWMGCERQEENEPIGQESFSLSICLPADEAHSMGYHAPRRVMGDPGMTETFMLPKYVYIFVVKEKAVDDCIVWEIVEETASAENWEKQYYSGPLMGNRDSVYRFNKKIVMPLVDQKFKGRIYAIASAKKLTFNTSISNTPDAESTEEALLDLKFSTSPDSIQENLQNIYSTPYNYEVDGNYYGSFSSIDHKVPFVYLMLYHVAAKVDITWNVVDSMRIRRNPAEAVRLTQMDVCNLFNGDAYCFKPMENSTGTTSVLTTNDTIHGIVTEEDEGLWWEGRSYFYTIPYTTTKTDTTDYFPLQMRMATNGSTDYCRPTLFLHIDKTSPFVPWLRATFNLTRPLEESAPAKKVD